MPAITAMAGSVSLGLWRQAAGRKAAEGVIQERLGMSGWCKQGSIKCGSRSPVR
jgi:hypothetical protein